jgi:hypothetical protein
MAALAGAALVVTRPEVGLLALVFLTYTHLPTVAVEYHGAPEALKLYPLALWALVGVRWVLHGEAPAGWLRSTALVALFGLTGVISLVAAVDLAEGQQNLLRYAKDVLMVAFIAATLHRWATFRRTAWALVLAGAFLGTITAYQWVTGTFDRTYGGFGQVPFALEGLDLDRSAPYRLAGPVGDPNFYAQLLLVPIALSVERLRQERGLAGRALAGWTLAACLISVVGTYSRGAGVALAAMLVAWLLRPSRHPGRLVVLAAVALLAVQLLPAEYARRVQLLSGVAAALRDDPAADSAVTGRLTEMLAAWAAFVDHPLTGVGIGNFSRHYQRYAQDIGFNVRLTDRPAHSLYLEIAAEQGALGLAAFGLVVASAFGGLLAARRRHRPGRPDRASLVGAFAVGLAGVLVAALFLQSSYPHALWLLIGIGLAVRGLPADAGAAPPAGPALPAAAGEVRRGD